ncbi:magnesium transporter [Bizionia argentinensis JUB59]|uniref:Magnesium transporter MgtE n=1 Tax=Bizionia argentinensis JUB59 TaxID=1046627 RepID=G2EE54_9FLAO|nr:magnesium transporter [Bizionia argentinensis]EGV43288.1 magnesium transporter [Bizionia argentinensis JUB59]
MPVTETDYLELIKNKKWRVLRRALHELDSLEAAELVENASKGNKVILFRLLTREQTKDVFKLLPHSEQEDVIEGLAENFQKLARLLSDIKPDDRTAFFEELPGDIAQRLIQKLTPEEQKISIQLLSYPKDSIGRLMTPEFVAIKAEFTVAEAFAHIREHGKDSETLNVIYVIDDNWKLIDDVTIKELILAPPGQIVDDLINHRFVSLNALDDQETAISVFKDYDRVALPVLSKEGVLLGIVTFDDIMDVIEEESTEDFHKFGSVQNASKNPLKERIFNLYKNRIVWLVLLVFMNIFSGAALASFEDVIQSFVALVFFLPLLIDSGGNAGSQSATLMIRYLALGEIQISDWYKLIGRELLVSFLLGITMAISIAAVASFRAPEIIIVVCIAMVINVMLGSLIGLLLPFIFTKLKIDPATASAPLVTSLSDICGVLIYFSLATRLLEF